MLEKIQARTSLLRTHSASYLRSAKCVIYSSRSNYALKTLIPRVKIESPIFTQLELERKFQLDKVKDGMGLA